MKYLKQWFNLVFSILSEYTGDGWLDRAQRTVVHYLHLKERISHLRNTQDRARQGNLFKGIAKAVGDRTSASRRLYETFE